jgi:regulator of sirC expression with transglutaminase-like and TPR domain
MRHAPRSGASCALRQRHQTDDRWAEALAVQSQLVQLRPDDRRELMVRAGLYERLGCPRAAAVDLQTCLRLDPDAADTDSIRQRCLQLQQQARRLN